MRLKTISIFVLMLAGFGLRLHYLVSTHPFFDEYTTVLAARQILRYGWPRLPSGLFYEHGLLATYLAAPFTALFIHAPISEWQLAHWGLMLARWPSLLVSTATIPLIYAIGRSCFRLDYSTARFAAAISLFAAGLFALSPEGMVWGGRARMYALATLLVLLTTYWAYRGAVYPGLTKYRWGALLALQATLLTHFGAIILVLPLALATVAAAWFTWPSRQNSARLWFLRRTIFLEGLALSVVVGLAVVVKRLGQPLGVASLDKAAENSALLPELFNTTIAYQAEVHVTWSDTVTFLARQFGVPHHIWLTVALLVGAALGLIFWPAKNQSLSSDAESKSNSFFLFLWLVFGLIIFQMVTLLDPFRRNPRYIVMFLPLFYLLAARSIFNFRLLGRGLIHFANYVLRIRPHLSAMRLEYSPKLQILAVLMLLLLFSILGLDDVRVALQTPEPAYEQAFAKIYADWEPEDVLLTMNTPAAGLYLERADGFTVQVNAEQFLLNKTTAPVDRWLGTPWLGTAANFYDALNRSERAWFVIDTIRQPVYFQGDWLAIVNNQMEPVWANDNVIVYRTRPDRSPLPTVPNAKVNATLGNSVQLIGYSLEKLKTQSNASISQASTSDLQKPGAKLQLTLFWQALASSPSDYIVFVHLRDRNGLTVAQQDGQPLDGVYPTSRWQPGETIIDPISLALPDNLTAGPYILFVGLYQLDTLERLPVVNDSSGENAIVLGEVILP